MKTTFKSLSVVSLLWLLPLAHAELGLLGLTVSSLATIKSELSVVCSNARLTLLANGSRSAALGMQTQVGFKMSAKTCTKSLSTTSTMFMGKYLRLTQYVYLI